MCTPVHTGIETDSQGVCAVTTDRTHPAHGALMPPGRSPSTWGAGWSGAIYQMGGAASGAIPDHEFADRGSWTTSRTGDRKPAAPCLDWHGLEEQKSEPLENPQGGGFPAFTLECVGNV